MRPKACVRRRLWMKPASRWPRRSGRERPGRDFSPMPNKAWDDITYTTTRLDYLRRHGLSRADRGLGDASDDDHDLALQALSRRYGRSRRRARPFGSGSQYTSDDWQSFLKPMAWWPAWSTRNCHDNASGLLSVKKERARTIVLPLRRTLDSSRFQPSSSTWFHCRYHGTVDGSHNRPECQSCGPRRSDRLAS